MKRWVFRKVSQDILSQLREWGLDSVKARILASRGVKDIPSLRKFLYPTLDKLDNPYFLPDLEKGVERIKEAVKNRENVLLFGDYDVDGITSLVIVYQTLKELGLNPVVYIPSRLNEGYGLNRKVFDLVKSYDIKVLICVDLGSSDAQILNTLELQGVSCIVLDHHKLGENLPQITAFINPNRPSYKGFRSYSSAGLCFKFSWAILGRKPLEFLDLVVLSVVCDLVPLIDENRIFVKEGLKFLKATSRVGLRVLMEEAGVQSNNLNLYHIGFILGPRLNSSGRVDSASVSFKLLTTSSLQEASILAKKLESFNRLRQEEQKRVYNEAIFLIEKNIDFSKHRVLVLNKEDWHIGVLGIVASQLTQQFHRPTLLLTSSGGIYKGSGRSIENFDITGAIALCKEYLLSFGGHTKACGISLEEKFLEIFKEKINNLASLYIKEEDLIPYFEIDAVLEPHSIDMELINFLNLLPPFGEGNFIPLFCSSLVLEDTLKEYSSDKKIYYLNNNSLNIGFIFDNSCYASLKTYSDCSKFNVLYHLEQAEENLVYAYIKDISPQNKKCTPSFNNSF